MKVLLVYPEFPDTYWSFKHTLPFLHGKKSTYPPLGLLTVSAMLPRHWQKRAVDLNVQPLKDRDLDWADVVFFSAMIIQSGSLKQQIERCRRRGLRTVVGGPITSSKHEALVGADHVVEGEVEEFIGELASDLERGEAKDCYVKGALPGLTGTPPPDLHLVNLQRYTTMAVQYSRGCPFNCEFCDIIEIYGRKPRTKAPEQIMVELDQIHRLGWRGGVFFVDDNFIGNKKEVKVFLPHLIRWMRDHKFPFHLVTEASVNLAQDSALLQMMRDANFTSVFLGIETPVVESLKETQKYQNTGVDLLDSVKLIQSYGIEVMAGFIVGFDNDPPDVFERQIRFIREAAIPLSMVGLLNALPNTQLWHRLKREGRLLKESIGNNTLADLNFIPNMDPAELLAGYRKILETIYNPREYFERATAFLSQMGAASHVPITLSDLMVLGRSLWRQGLRSNYRTDYWRFVVESLRLHRQHFGMAIGLAVMGHHFFELTADTQDS